ncbi:hypothetical protein LAZ67_10002797 [Cordylochernes scorpioides]|uniref:Integrase catalytic domain-containing protein n=1 Tax=Cordylochernes scorpioides TaxID=51811 RepID=A0ABY6KXK9_9ARAC|nr:hypothetical protein LAZ67_10002797 [Cordylochernes scorpioides]
MKLTGQATLETYYREKTAMGLQLGLPQEVILETLTEGLPFNDQRLVRVVPPENLGEWFRLVQRIHVAQCTDNATREDQPPTMSGPYHSTPPTPRCMECTSSTVQLQVLRRETLAQRMPTSTSPDDPRKSPDSANGPKITSSDSTTTKSSQRHPSRASPFETEVPGLISRLPEESTDPVSGATSTLQLAAPRGGPRINVTCLARLGLQSWAARHDVLAGRGQALLAGYRPRIACAPYLAIRTLHQIAHEVQVSNPRVSKIIREDFYVDDLLTGCPTVEDAKGLVQQLIAVLGSGGFVLRKWVSNETSIIEDLPLLLRGKGRPFEKIGIDLAGPIHAKPMLKRSKVIFKFYIVLFVCFTTEAIHLEISSDLTAETFLAALKRFISRRGRPTDIYSDNATNFKGASNILKERWKLFNAANIQDFSAIESINWHFIPPSAPNFGGLWDAGIKSVKTILSKTMKSRLLNYEELLTLLAQIEACLNSRPLTFVSNDPNELTALTPGHFLIGNAMRHDAESDHSTLNLRFRWSLIQPQRDYFWNRWSCEYLHQLQERRKWRTSHPDVNIGDLVMLKEQNKPLQWKLARIVQIFPGEDDHVRVVLLRTPKGLLKRPITKICPLPYKE